MTMPKEAMRGFLAVALLACFMLALAWLMRAPVPEPNRDLVTYMLGQVSGFASACVVFYFGTTKGSADKTDIIAKMPPPGSPAAAETCRCGGEGGAAGEAEGDGFPKGKYL